MKRPNISIKKYLLVFIAAVGILLGGLFLLPSQHVAQKVNTNVNVDKSLLLRFETLSTEGNSFCFGPDAVMRKSDSDYLTGSCCGPMALHRYQEQIEGLKKYSNIDKIPSDPYNISVSLAKELINYDNTITLNNEQQKAYNDAMKMSAEGGPCCCQCWRWYVYEGLAKYLIVEYNFSSSQIAEVWNLSDGCGGNEHSPGFHT